MPLSYCQLARDITYYGLREGWLSRTGVADNDHFYHSSKSEIYVPWRGFNKSGLKEVFHQLKDEAFEISREIHHKWGDLNQAQRRLAASIVHTILGKNLDEPSEFVLIYSDNGTHLKFQRRICDYFGIEVFNLSNYHLHEIRSITGVCNTR